MKKKVVFEFEQELIERLRELSKETYIPQVRIMQMALEKFMDEKEKEMK